MTKTLKNNKRNLVLLIIIWGLVLALTLIGVYMYYDQKIEQLEQSIDKQPETVGHRMSVLPVRPLHLPFKVSTSLRFRRAGLAAEGTVRRASGRGGD